MSITIFQVQNVLRTYQNLFRSKSAEPDPTSETPEVRKGNPSFDDASPRDRVTISEASRRKLSELHPAEKGEEGSDHPKRSTEEEGFAQS